MIAKVSEMSSFRALSCLLSAFFAVPAFSQTWTLLNPSPQGTDLTALNIVDSLRAYAAGPSGTLVKTTDGGATWSSRAMPAGLSGLRFVGRDTAYATFAETEGMIRRTTDGGSTWTEHPAGSISAINAMHFWNGRTGVVAGNSGIWRTTNAGASWTRNPADFGIRQFYSLAFPTPDTGYVFGNNGSQYKSVDSGVTWTLMASSHTSNLTDAQFLSPRVGYVLSAGTNLLKTTNGGVTWAAQSRATGTLRSVQFVNERTGYTATTGHFYTTRDSGKTWTETPFPYPPTALNVRLRGAWGVGVGVGGFITTSADSGKTWTLRSGVSSQIYADVHFPDAHTGYAVGTGSDIVRTADGGATWSLLPRDTLLDNSLWSVHFVTPNVGYVGGGNGIFKTTNGGQSWTRSFWDPSSYDYFYALQFFGDTGWAAGQGPRLLRTTNGGATWDKLDATGTGADLRAMHMTGGNKGVVVGPPGYVLRNAGGTWSRRTVPVSATLYAVHFPNPAVGYAAGSNALIKTLDSGKTWTTLSTAAAQWNALFFVDSVTGYGTRDKSIVKTTDGGLTWNPETVPGSSGLYPFALCFTSRATGFAVGENGYLARFGDAPAGVRRAAATNAPGGFRVRRGVLEYTLTEPARVRVRLLRPDGKVIADLLNARQAAGAHALPLQRPARKAFLEVRLNGKALKASPLEAP
jgi:photosystem II stability/assembly factor-like uncharacterized protein